MPQSPTSPPRLIDLIEARSAARPDDIAIEHDGRALTYGRLDALASAFAAELRDAGVRPRDRVGVFLRRSPEMVVAIVAVLKLGAAYVPQDTGIAPAVQLAEVVRRTDMSVVLTTAAHPTPLLDGVTVIAVDATRRADSPRAAQRAAQRTATRPSSPDLPCLVIFTSGTTGVPKGVVVTDGNLVNLLTRSPGDLGLGPGVRVSQLMNIAFDMAAWEILGALVNGATLVIRGRDFTETASSVDVVVATPGILSRIDPDSCTGVSRVAVAGERCPVELADRWARQATFHNCCGPTEVTIVNTIGEHRPGAPLTIGRPVPGTTVYLLDDAGCPVRPGDLGEMWVGGAGVTAGYLDDDLTRERYRLDPFAADGSMMFATRDLARLTADGSTSTTAAPTRR
jgi:amino acid adenylation domain-containing protein